MVYRKTQRWWKKHFLSRYTFILYLLIGRSVCKLIWKCGRSKIALLKSLQVTKFKFRLPTKSFGAYTSILLVYTLFFIRTSSLKFTKNIKNMLSTYPSVREEKIIFHCFYFPKSRESRNVLHGIRVHVKYCCFNTFPLCLINNTFTL